MMTIKKYLIVCYYHKSNILTIFQFLLTRLFFVNIIPRWMNQIKIFIFRGISIYK
jgi:hypothetical protein